MEETGRGRPTLPSSLVLLSETLVVVLEGPQTPREDPRSDGRLGRPHPPVQRGPPTTGTRCPADQGLRVTETPGRTETHANEGLFKTLTDRVSGSRLPPASSHRQVTSHKDPPNYPSQGYSRGGGPRPTWTRTGDAPVYRGTTYAQQSQGVPGLTQTSERPSESEVSHPCTNDLTTSLDPEHLCLLETLW